MGKLGKKIAAADNVATVLTKCDAGDQIVVKFNEQEESYLCSQDVPFGHKIAITDILKENKIIKYGKEIGSARVDIKKGEWVHTHNVKDDYLCLDKQGNPLPGQEA